jgi:hypothetical protein
MVPPAQRQEDEMVRDLGVERAIRANDARGLTPLQLLRHLVAEVEAGNIDANKLLVAWFGGPEDDMSRGTAFAGVSRIEAVALLNLTLSDVIESWKGR